MGQRREVTNPSTGVLEQDEGRSDQAQKKIDINSDEKKRNKILKKKIKSCRFKNWSCYLILLYVAAAVTAQI